MVLFVDGLLVSVLSDIGKNLRIFSTEIPSVILVVVVIEFIVLGFFKRCGVTLSSSIDCDQLEGMRQL